MTVTCFCRLVGLEDATDRMAVTTHRWLLAVVLQYAGPAWAQQGKSCTDTHADCPNWAQSGECQSNPAYMHGACRRSCGLCGDRQQRPSGSGPSPSRRGVEKSSDVLKDAAYTLHAGRIRSRSQLKVGRYDLLGARRWCDANAACTGFSVQVSEPQPFPSGLLAVHFHADATSVQAGEEFGLSWASFLKSKSGAHSSGSCGEGDEACASAQREERSSYLKQQQAAYYLETAEILSAWPQKAQAVVEQVRAALLNGASREASYLARASAYLQLGNIDNCKRDLSAILRSDPEHAAAKALHRKVKQFAKRLDDAAQVSPPPPPPPPTRPPTPTLTTLSSRACRAG